MDLVSHFTKATENPYSYLFINFTQECEPKVRFLSELFNRPHAVKVHNEHGSKLLFDDNTSSKTNFKSISLSEETRDSCNCEAMRVNNDNYDKHFYEYPTHNTFVYENPYHLPAKYETYIREDEPEHKIKNLTQQLNLRFLA